LGGREWSYLDTGQGETPLLLAVGALGTADSSWLAIRHFAGASDGKGYRVIAPEYPAGIDTMAGLADGMAALLDLLGIESAPLMGGSFGGTVAQVYVRRHQDRTRDLVLSHTLVPDPERGLLIERALRWLRFLPTPMLRSIIKRRLGGLLPEDPSALDDEALARLTLLRAQVEETIDLRWSRQAFFSGFRRTADFDLNYTFASGDLAGWPGRAMLLMAEDDPATPEEEREAIRAIYPRAEVQLLSGAAHASALVNPQAYYAQIETFLTARSG
jgi:pimeloyl-ACP methyl ester carboxylesterase